MFYFLCSVETVLGGKLKLVFINTSYCSILLISLIFDGCISFNCSVVVGK